MSITGKCELFEYHPCVPYVCQQKENAWKIPASTKGNMFYNSRPQTLTDWQTSCICLLLEAFICDTCLPYFWEWL